MRRDNYTMEGSIKEFQNGNINLKIDNSRIEDVRAGHVSAYELFAYLLDSLDCYFIGDSGCFGNDEMSQEIYCANNGKMYTTLLYRNIERDFAQGKTVKLYARTPDKNDQELIAQWYQD